MDRNPNSIRRSLTGRLFEASTADWRIVWNAHLSLQDLFPSPEPLEYTRGCRENPRPVRPNAPTIFDRRAWCPVVKTEPRATGTGVHPEPGKARPGNRP